MLAYFWGVDSSTPVTSELYGCVLTHFGKPSFWGRYLVTVPGASEGLTNEEITLLHNSGIKILPIFNKFTTTTGYQNGSVTAQNAIYYALWFFISVVSIDFKRSDILLFFFILSILFVGRAKMTLIKRL